MKTYRVVATRQVSQTATFYVKAETREDATDLAESELDALDDDEWDGEPGDAELSRPIEVPDKSEDDESENDDESEDA